MGEGVMEHLSDNAGITICVVTLIVTLGWLIALGMWTGHVEEKLKIAAGFSSREKAAMDKLATVRKVLGE